MFFYRQDTNDFPINKPTVRLPSLSCQEMIEQREQNDACINYVEL